MGRRREEFILPEGGLLIGNGGGGERRVLVEEEPAGLEAMAIEGILEEEDMTEEYLGGDTLAEIGGELIW